jgi:hypothetical protein
VELGKHFFPQGISSVDVAIDLVANTGGIMAVGTHRDRKKASQNTKIFPSAPEGSSGTDLAECYMKFNRKDKAEVYHKPTRLKEELDRLFDVRPKLSPEQAKEELKKMIDPADGGLMFCWKKRGEFLAKSHPLYKDWFCSLCSKKPCDCNGMLPTVDMITQYFSTKSASDKRNKQKATTSDAPMASKRMRTGES